MRRQPARGMSRQGLDAAFEQDEARQSNLILEGRLLREQGQDEAAADKFAEAAEIEERLSDICAAKGLVEKSFVHRFSAASGRAQRGNFYHTIALCDDLLAQTDLPKRPRQRIQNNAQTLGVRRAQWHTGLVLSPREAKVEFVQARPSAGIDVSRETRNKLVLEWKR